MVIKDSSQHLVVVMVGEGRGLPAGSAAALEAEVHTGRTRGSLSLLA